MARRGYIGGERRGFQISPIDFLRGGGGDNKEDTAMAMALMGYGKGTSPQDQALEAQKQAWAEKYQSGQLSIEELKQKAAEANYKSEAEARTAAATNAAQQRIDEAAKQAALEKYQTGQLDYLKSKADRDAAVEVFKNAVEHGNLKEGTPQYEILAEAAMPGYKEKSTAAKKAIFEQNVATGLEKYQKATPKEKAAFNKAPGSLGVPPDVFDEILKRSQVQVAQPGAPTAAPGEGRLPLSAPTAPVGSDIFSEKGVRIVPPIAPSVDARDYGKFPGSVEDLIRLSSNKPIPEQLVVDRSMVAPPVVSAPPTPVNMPRASTESIAPGLNMPREQFNLIPESTDQYQPAAAFSRQGLPDLHLIPEPYVRPQMDLMVDDLLKRLRMGGGNTDIPMPTGSGYPFPVQGVFQPHPG
jgi:hypothetical protein